MVLVLFGASGDLTRRKLIPALFRIFQQGLLPETFLIIGFARTRMSEEDYRHRLAADFPVVDAPAQWREFIQQVTYMHGDYRDMDAFYRIRHAIDAVETSFGQPCLRLYYLATPPSVFADIGTALARSRLATREGLDRMRIAIEKPFGHDLPSAQALNRHFLASFAEEQIYRIDHYLGKETVQNILYLRFANGIFEPIWNRNYIDHLQFTVAEELVLEGRVGYYDAAGAMRDIMQNHVLQLICLATMEPPTSLNAEAIRDQKVNVLKSVRPLQPDEVLSHTARGQYTSGSHKGRQIVGYLAEEDIPSLSKTETYAAWKLEIDNWRWQGVPCYVRSGKGLNRKVTEIVIQFHRPPHLLFAQAQEGYSAQRLFRNSLRLRLQPEEGIELDIGVKSPGPAFQMSPVQLDFSYQEAFGPDLLDAYERLLLDLIAGDRTLFTRRDEVEVAWEHVSRILDVWSEENRQADFVLPQYAPGSWGPSTGDDLLQQDQRRWLTR